MRESLIPVQNALQKVVLLTLHEDTTTEEFKKDLEAAIEDCKKALNLLYSQKL
jgi:hypothetical protein